MRIRANFPRTALYAFIAGAISTSALTAHAFDVPVHVRITNAEIRALRAEVNGQSKGFSPTAVEQIAKANEDVDDLASAALFKPERHFTNDDYRDASQRLMNLRREIVSLVDGEKRDGSKARERMGQALHTLQDFYAHSNWVERGNGSINSALGVSLLANPAATGQPCPTNPNVLGAAGGGSDTSGFFVGASLSRDTFGCDVEKLPANKCFHGNYTRACVGINKDLDATGAAQNDVPQNPHHGAAASLGRQATRAFVQSVLTELAGKDRALTALLDVRGTLAFVVDDTGSMGSSIAGVSSTINQMVSEVSADPALAPDNYLFVRYGDPDIGSPLITEDASVLHSAVASLSPQGGGDCPELSQGALIRAVDGALPDSRVFLFTDATAKDSTSVNQVIARAQAKGTELVYGLTGSCSPIDSAYIRGAAETGGQVFRVFPHEIPLLLEFIRPQLKGNLAMIARRRIDLGQAGAETIAVPVDSGMTGLLVSLSVVENDVPASHRVRLTRPTGEQVSSTDADVKIVTLSTGVIVHIDSPSPGSWTVEVTGYGPFTATVQGNSPIDIARFDFVEPSGDIHGGFHPLPGQPVVGTPGLGEATLVGPVATAAFQLIDEAGQSLVAAPLANEFPSANPEHFLGEVALPSVPFRVSVRGVDGNGQPYLREYPAVYRAQTLQVMTTGFPIMTLAPGVPKVIHFSVENLGQPGAFRNAASDQLGYVGTIAPATLSLGTGEKAEVSVTLTAPVNAEENATTEVTFTSTRTDINSVFNSATTVATVVGNRPPVCSSITRAAPIWPPNGKFVSIDVAQYAGVVDPDNDDVAIAIKAVTQDEPVFGRGGAGDSAPDAMGLGSGHAELRAERRADGNGRVYGIQYQATDAKGASCDGTLYVGVAHDHRGDAAVDDGQEFDATQR